MRDPVAVGPEPDEGIDFGGDHDWDDAEALVIRKIERPPSATAGQEVSVARPDAPPTPLFQRQAVPPPIPPAGTAAAPSSDDDGLWDDDGSDWDSEAEVVIVSRPRAQEADPVAAAPARETAPKARPVIAPIGHGREGGDKGGYDGFLEEATVTIIRAEASETTTSAMFPNKVANDAEKPGAASSQDRRLKQKGLGSRFLKALTGD